MGASWTPETDAMEPRVTQTTRNCSVHRDLSTVSGWRKSTTGRAFTTADGREAVLWDSTEPRLGLRARPNGRMTWIVRRRCNGSVVRRTLGPLDALTVGGRAGRGAHGARQCGGGVDRAALTAPKVRSFPRTFLADCAERWKPTTRKTYAFNVRRWIEPAFGDRRVDSIGPKDVRSWFDGIAATHRASAGWALAATGRGVRPGDVRRARRRRRAGAARGGGRHRERRSRRAGDPRPHRGGGGGRSRQRDAGPPARCGGRGAACSAQRTPAGPTSR